MASQLAGFVFTLLLAYTSANNDTDGTEVVDFLVGMYTDVRLYHSGDNSTYDLVMNTSDWALSLDYHYEKNVIFAHADHNLFKATLEAQRVTETTALDVKLVKPVSSNRGFAVDWVHDRIYWANPITNGTSIMACGLDGEAEQTVLTRAFNGEVYRMEIDPYRGIVFWTAAGVIHLVETSGEGYNPNVTKSEVHMRAFTLDLRRRRVYYLGGVDQSLYSIDYTGGEKVMHFSVPQGRSVFGLSILGDKVLWQGPSHDFDGIYEAPLNLTRMEDAKLVIEFNSLVWHMRVMHPSLQRRPEIDPCLDKGCTHSCVASGATTATCECPPGQALNNDGVSCHDITDYTTPPQTTEYSTTTSESATSQSSITED